MNEQNCEFVDLDAANREIVRLRDIVHSFESGSAAPKPPSFADLFHLYNELLLTHTPNMIFLFNEELEYVIGSSACRKLTRQDRVDLTHRPLPLLFCKEVDGHWVEKVCRLNHEVLTTRKPVTFRDTIKIDDAETVHVYVTISPMIDDAGNKRGTIMALNDVTELVNVQRQAEQAAKSKASFLANMSHEIRTPMNAIKGLSELLAITTLTDTQRNYVKNIISSSKSLINVINDVLDFSKIDADRIEIVPVHYNLNKLVSDLCGTIGLRAEEKGLNLFLEIDPNIPSRLIGDDNRIKQVLLNLLSNAVKYTHSGHIILKAKYLRQAPNMITLQFFVEDTGIGVKSEDIPLLFDAFSRVDLKANRSVQGTGLGLAISKHLAEAMNGTISLQSVYGHGSTFTFSIPQGVDDATPLASIEDGEMLNVLLIGSGLRIVNAGATLRRLGVEYSVLVEADDDVELARKLADVRVALPEAERPFTHCMYTEAAPEGVVAAVRGLMSGGRFAIMRSLINNLERDSGRDVTLFNPLLVTELAKFLNKSGKSSSKRGISADTSVARKLRVVDAVALVVDDNRINLMVCEKMLDVFGLTVQTASSGPEALTLAHGRRFDIIFVDHMMPGMDGIEVTSEIRTKPGPNRRTPIVALTANVVNDMRSQYLKCGMDDFVPKPIERQELSRILLQWLPPHKIGDSASR